MPVSGWGALKVANRSGRVPAYKDLFGCAQYKAKNHFISVEFLELRACLAGTRSAVKTLNP
jgi:hypothetical protein